jgi:hypothetical protein
MTDGARQRILGGLSLDEAWRHLRWLEEHAPTRISGTQDQVRAGEYFAETLEGYGCRS